MTREFLTRFVLPLIKGGDVYVGTPIDMERYLSMTQELAEAGEAVSAIDAARHDILCEVVLDPPVLSFGEEELALAVAVHNLLFLSHPRGASASLTRRVLATAAELADQSVCEDCATALSRHGLLHALFDVARADTRVSWWLGSRTFLGQKPPPRLTRLKTVRRVREEQVWVGFAELLRTAQSQPVLSAILRRSPLTPFLARAVDAPAIRLEEAMFLLRDAELARAIAYAAIAGDTAEEKLAKPSAYGAALEQMLERNPDEAEVRTMTAFLVYLNTLLVMAEQDLARRGGARISLLSELAPERTGQRMRGLVTFLAVPSAIERVDPRLCQVPGISADPKIRHRWQRHQHKVAELVGEAVIEALASRFRRHLTGVIELRGHET